MPEHLEYRHVQTRQRQRSVWLSRLALTLSLISLLLVMVSLMFRINLVEGSVVSDVVAGTPVHFILLILTAPGLALSMVGIQVVGPLGYCVGAGLGQLLVYWPLAALVEYLRRLIQRRRG